MTCAENLRLLTGYFDGELDLRGTIDVEDHLRGCGACTQALKVNQSLRQGFAAAELRYSAPAQFVDSVHNQLAKAFPAPLNAPAARNELKSPRMAWWQWAPAFALLVLSVGLSWKLWNLRDASSRVSLADEAVSEHIRSLMPGHLGDVESTDQHNVKPWFNGKLDFSPPVQDFAAQGFPLVAGRLDYLDHHPVAAIVYQRRKHVINVFVRAERGARDAGVQFASEQGYNAYSWTRDGMSFWAVSDLNATELRQFVDLLRPSDGPQR